MYIHNIKYTSIWYDYLFKWQRDLHPSFFILFLSLSSLLQIVYPTNFQTKRINRKWDLQELKEPLKHQKPTLIIYSWSYLCGYHVTINKSSLCSSWSWYCWWCQIPLTHNINSRFKTSFSLLFLFLLLISSSSSMACFENCSIWPWFLLKVANKITKL